VRVWLVKFLSPIGPTQTFRNVSSHVGCLGQSGLIVLGTRFSESGRVEMWRGGFRFEHICFPPLSFGGALVVRQ
jgi:hypothetical protein